MGLGRKLYSAWGRCRLSWQGVVAEPGLVLFGRPLIVRAPDSAIVIGRKVVLCSNCRGNPLGVNHPVILRTLRPGSRISIGADTGLSGATICAACSVTVGAQCLIGANVTITDYDFHALAPDNRRYNNRTEDIGCAPVVIEDNVWLGLNVVVLKGVTIGRNTVVGAGSLVTQTLPADCVAAGQPARVLRRLDERAAPNPGA